MIRTTNRFGVSAAIAAAVAVSLLLLWPALPAQAQSSTTGATFTVRSTDDTDGNTCGSDCTLRQAINAANANPGDDTIVFDLGGSATITLGSTLPAVTDQAGLTINGGQESITVSGGDKVQVFSESKDAKLALENLTVAHGFRVNTPTTQPQTDGTGGGIKNDGGTLTVTGSTFTDNNANVGGGIANVNGGMLTVINSTFSGNGAVAGGGIVNNGTLTVTNSTFSGNGADLGSGIQNALVGAATVKLSNTILANSTSSGSNCRGKITDVGYNISDDSSCGFSASTSKNSTNPLLDPNSLQNNGGPTQTIALESSSPAIDVIPEGTNGCGIDIKTDQRGVTRPQGSGCDIGAFELYQGPPPPGPPPPGRHHKHHGGHHHNHHHSGGGGGGGGHHKHHGGNSGGGGGGGGVIQ